MSRHKKRRETSRKARFKAGYNKGFEDGFVAGMDQAFDMKAFVFKDQMEKFNIKPPIALLVQTETKCTEVMTQADLNATLEAVTVFILESLFGDASTIVRTPVKFAAGPGCGILSCESKATLSNGVEFELRIHQQRLVREIKGWGK